MSTDKRDLAILAEALVVVTEGWQVKHGSRPDDITYNTRAVEGSVLHMTLVSAIHIARDIVTGHVIQDVDMAREGLNELTLDQRRAVLTMTNAERAEELAELNRETAALAHLAQRVCIECEKPTGRESGYLVCGECAEKR